MKNKIIKKTSIIGIIGNIFLAIIKLTIGFITKSQSMIADAFNSVGDIFSCIMTFIANKISMVPPDADHNLGHGKAEYIFSLIISEVILFVSYKTFLSSLMSIINKTKYTPNIYLIIVCIVTIIIKLSLFVYSKSSYKKYNNILLKANYKDHLNDSLITLLNLISIIFAFYHIFIIDGIVGMIISIWIAKSGIELFIESYNILMDHTMAEETRKKVYEIIDKHEEIIKTRHFNATPVGYKYQISITIFVDGNLLTHESHEIADNLEKEIVNNIEEVYLAVIHVNPV